MISLTTYWQQFQECIDAIKPENPSDIYKKQVSIAKRLVETGLTIEQLSAIRLKGVGEVLADIAKEFNHEVSISDPPHVHSFYLPKISDTNGLILAIAYYQHLNNYQTVAYKGSLFIGQAAAEKGVQDKKRRVGFQAAAMLNEIKDYCQKNSLILNESELLRKEQESAGDYMARIPKSFTPEKKAEEITVPADKIPEDPKAPTEHPLQVETKDELQQLKDCLDVLKKKETELQTKIDQLAKRLMDYRQSTQQYVELNKQWDDKSWFSKFMIWIASIFRNDTFIHQMTKAQTKQDEASQTLNNEFTPYKSADDYQTALKIQLHATSTDFEDTKKQYEQLNLERIKSEMQKQVALQVPVPDPTTTEAPPEIVVQIEKPVRKEPSIQQSAQFSLFKYAPSSDTIMAAAVAGVAIVYENYFRQSC